MIKKILVLSGAGIDAESGIPTFRDSNGLWENHKVEDVCNIHTWQQNYELVHKFYDDRREQLKTVFPNVAHSLVAYWQKKYTCVNITTNVSDLFERAGVVDTVHLHGYIPEVYCTDCGRIHNLGYERLYNTVKVQDDEEIVEKQSLNMPFFKPEWHRRGCSYFSFYRNRVPEQAHIFKPNVVFFGEMAPKYNDLYNALNACDHETVIIIVGASNIVVDFISLCINLPAKLIIIDKNPNLLDNYNVHSDAVFLCGDATTEMLNANILLESM